MTTATSTTAKFRFVRPHGRLGPNKTAATDALNALKNWQRGVPGRSYKVEYDPQLTDEGDLIVSVTHGLSDSNAGAQLAMECDAMGVSASREA